MLCERVSIDAAGCMVRCQVPSFVVDATKRLPPCGADLRRLRLHHMDESETGDVRYLKGNGKENHL